MGDLSEIRGLVVAITFLGTFVTLVTLMPPQLFYVTEQQHRTVNIPEYFDVEEVTAFVATHNFTIGNDYSVFDFALGGFNFEWETNTINNGFLLFTYDSFWVFKWNFDSFRWYDKNGIEQSIREGIKLRGGSHYILKWDKIDANYDNDTKKCKYTLQNSITKVTLFFGFNQTLYSKPSEALANDDLHVLIAMGIDNINTSTNIWTIISMLLFIEAPNVHWSINFIINLPFWVTIAYLIYVLVIKLIPFAGE